MPPSVMDTRGFGDEPGLKRPPPFYDALPRSVNYSPKHLRQPSSLLSSRNLNMKNLQLNLTPPSLSAALPPRRNLAVAIPPSPHQPLLLSSPPHGWPAPPALQSPFRSHPLLQNALKAALRDSLCALARALPASLPYTYAEPEELQEQSTLNAYPDGPANVLSLVLYLYLDPRHSRTPIDINQYDLVINVASECDNLAAQFDASQGRRYIYVPWSHNLPILHELPQLTRTIADFDRAGRKILVHCQCGVLRLACVIVAYFMVKFALLVNEAYELLKTGTGNTREPCIRHVADAGYTVQACERICPNMNLIFELMDFGEALASTSGASC